MTALSQHQEEVVRQIAAGRMSRYKVPGRWEALIEGEAIILRNLAEGWEARVPFAAATGPSK